MSELASTMASVYEEVESIATSLDLMMDEAFTQYMGDILTECQVVDDYYLAPYYNKKIGARIDAYEFEDESLTLFTTLWKNQTPEIVEQTITNTELNDAARRCLRFFTDSKSGKLPGERIDVGSPAYHVATKIFEDRAEIDTLKIIIITNGKAKRQHGKDEEADGVNVLWEIWDAERINDYKHNKETRGASIDFGDYDGPIDCVKFTTDNKAYTTYLAFVPGKVLADMYERHKTRLLERNVRVFLSLRRKVNKGIRDTIRHEPNLFCAYNNGITVVAEKVKIDPSKNGLEIKEVNDFQIVNGGQTTASLYHTRKKFKSNLSQIFVQMKLMVINDDSDSNAGTQRLADILIPKIGRFSNTQNKVTMSDLSANEKPHPEIHKISMSTPARDPTGGTNTYWFYENSRGKWDELRRHEDTSAKKRIFDSKYPKKQLFDKGLFARVWYSHEKKPYLVSKGPQKCFAFFQKDFLSKLDDDEDLEMFFKKTVALLIMWKAIYAETRKRIRAGLYQSFAQNITTYTLAMFSHKNPKFKLYEYIWEKQELDSEFLDYLMILADKAHNHLVDLPPGLNLVPEHAKKESCWENFEKEANRIPKLHNLLKLKMEGQNTKYTKQQIGDNATAVNLNVAFCMEIEVFSWRGLAYQIEFKRGAHLNSGKEQSQCNNMAKTIDQGKTPSVPLANACKAIYQRAIDDGWKF
jgi:hypothetical protein